MKLKKILKESNAPGYKDRKFGEKLPTLDSVKAAYEAKQAGNEVTEAAPKMKANPEAEKIDKLYKAAYLLKKGGSGNRYGKEFEKAKKKALKALADMYQYSKIGV